MATQVLVHLQKAVVQDGWQRAVQLLDLGQALGLDQAGRSLLHYLGRQALLGKVAHSVAMWSVAIADSEQMEAQMPHDVRLYDVRILVLLVYLVALLSSARCESELGDHVESLGGLRAEQVGTLQCLLREELGQAVPVAAKVVLVLEDVGIEIEELACALMMPGLPVLLQSSQVLPAASLLA